MRARLRICGVDDDFFRPGRDFPFDDLRFREDRVDEIGELLLEPSCFSCVSFFTRDAEASGTLLEIETGEGPKGIMLAATMFCGCIKKSLPIATAIEKPKIPSGLLRWPIYDLVEVYQIGSGERKRELKKKEKKERGM